MTSFLLLYFLSTLVHHFAPFLFPLLVRFRVPTCVCVRTFSVLPPRPNRFAFPHLRTAPLHFDGNPPLTFASPLPPGGNQYFSYNPETFPRRAFFPVTLRSTPSPTLNPLFPDLLLRPFFQMFANFHLKRIPDPFFSLLHILSSPKARCSFFRDAFIGFRPPS